MDANTESQLYNEYNEWLIAHGHPKVCARELLLSDVCNADEVKWLNNFITRWEEWEEWDSTQN